MYLIISDEILIPEQYVTHVKSLHISYLLDFPVNHLPVDFSPQYLWWSPLGHFHFYYINNIDIDLSLLMLFSN